MDICIAMFMATMSILGGIELGLIIQLIEQIREERNRSKNNGIVLISMSPKQWDLIVEGKKTIDLRKNRPAVKTPFKCYVYKTKNGGIVGEYVCDDITQYPYNPPTNSIIPSDGEYLIPTDELDRLCLDKPEIYKYLHVNDGYGWHISNLQIYNEPVGLGAFGKTQPPQTWCYLSKD